MRLIPGLSVLFMAITVRLAFEVACIHIHMLNHVHPSSRQGCRWLKLLIKGLFGSMELEVNGTEWWVSVILL